MKLISKVVAFAFTVVTTLGFAQTSFLEEAKTYPAAEKGMIQHIIYLPKSADKNESHKKVEVFVGKYMETDLCNNYGLMGEFVKKEVPGKNWLTYYDFQSKGDAISTMMGCMEAGTQTRLVKSQTLLMDYNGNLPIVIYTPEGMEVR